MSTFEREGYAWRETYFVLFESSKRLSLAHVEKLLKKLNPRFELASPTADEDGAFESITVLSGDDYAALDISFESGDEALEQAALLYEELKPTATDPDEKAKLARLRKLDAKFDLMHFEQVGAAAVDDEMEMLDPSALLVVLDALVEATGGVGVDPQSGAFM